MNSQVLGLRVASIIFGLVSLAQLLRLLIRPEVRVAGYELPLWPSALRADGPVAGGSTGEFDDEQILAADER